MATMASNSIKVDIMGTKLSTLKYKIEPYSTGIVQAGKYPGVLSVSTRRNWGLHEANRN